MPKSNLITTDKIITLFVYELGFIISFIFSTREMVKETENPSRLCLSNGQWTPPPHRRKKNTMWSRTLDSGGNVLWPWPDPEFLGILVYYKSRAPYNELQWEASKQRLHISSTYFRDDLKQDFNECTLLPTGYCNNSLVWQRRRRRRSVLTASVLMKRVDIPNCPIVSGPRCHRYGGIPPYAAQQSLCVSCNGVCLVSTNWHEMTLGMSWSHWQITKIIQFI